jgi:predicted metalloprotease with PDZ domain
VVNCESKYQPKFDYINRRDCRMPLVDDIQAEFHGNTAKLSWAVSLDGKKMQSETYKVLAILESNGIAGTNASQAKTLQSNPSQAAQAEIAGPSIATPIPGAVTTATPVAAPAAKRFTVQSVEPSQNAQSVSVPNTAPGWIGVTTAHFGSGGAVVTAVAPGGPAAKAGLRPGDVVNTVNGVSLKDQDLGEKIAAYKPGSTVRLGYMRDAWALEATVTVGTKTQ